MFTGWIPYAPHFAGDAYHQTTSHNGMNVHKEQGREGAGTSSWIERRANSHFQQFQVQLWALLFQHSLRNKAKQSDKS